MAAPQDVISQEPGIPREKKRGCFSCALVCLVVGVVFLLWLTWGIASMGFVRIPVFSALAFDEPTPTRVVEPADISPGSWLEDTIVSEFTRRLRAGEVVNRRISVTTPEGVLTTLVRFSAGNIDVEEIPLDLAMAQIVTQEDELEVFAPWKDKPTAVRVNVRPSVEEGKLQLSVQQVHVGSWRVPKFVISSVLNQVVRLGIDEVEKSIGKVLLIEDITVSEKGLIVTGELAPGVISF